MKTIACKLLSTALLLSALHSRAEVELYFGVDVSPWPHEPGNWPNNVPRPASTPNSTQAAGSFLSRLVGVHTESFEAFAYDSVPTNLTFGTNVAVLSSPANNPIRINTVTDWGMGTDGGGEYPAAGTNWLELVADGTTSAWFTVTFNTPQSAFGFWGSDVEVHTLRLVLVGTNGARTAVPVSIPVPQGSAGAYFLGVVDRANPFTAVEFQGTQDGVAGRDGWGFDDLTIGTPEQVLPAAAHLRMAAYPGLEISGTVGASYRIEFVTMLEATNHWATLTNLVLPASPHLLLDATSPPSQSRFYRAVGVP
jgi:hypothetical protein